jgi:hypothetical protein
MRREHKMNSVEETRLDGQPMDAYDLTLTGVADEIVREELGLLRHYESSDGRTFRLSHANLARLRMAIVERCGEVQEHPDGPLWSERQVYAHTAATAIDAFFEGDDEA